MIRPTHDETELSSLLTAIRRFYLEPQAFYSLAELAHVWRVPLDDMCLMFSDELAGVGLATVFHVFRPVDVERALADDFDRVRSDRWRTVRIEVHVPKFVAQGIAATPPVHSSPGLAAQAERILCEYVEAEHLAAAVHREDVN